MATNTCTILFTFTGNALRIYLINVTKIRKTHGTTPGKFWHQSLHDYSGLHIKCKINHVCGHSTMNLSYKHQQNSYKYHFIYFDWQWFENLCQYFNKHLDNTCNGSWEIWHQSLCDYSGLQSFI